MCVLASLRIKIKNMALAAGIISGAAGLAGTVFGAIKSAQERNRMKAYMETQKSDNEAWFDEKKYSDYTQRKDTQALMKSLRDNLKDVNQASNATAAVTGASPEAVAMQKAAQSEAVSDTFTNVAAQGQRVQDNAEAQYMARKSQLEGQELASMEGAAQGYENLLQNSLTTGLNGVVSSLNSSSKAGEVKKEG